MRTALKNVAIAACILVLIITVMVIAYVLDAKPVPEAQATAPTPTKVWQDAFIEGYTSRIGEPEDAAEYDEVIADAGVICSYLGDGTEHTLPLTWVYGTDVVGMSSDQAIVVIEEAIRTHCPEQSYLLKAGER